jgi:protein TonB
MKYTALLFCPDEKTARVVTQVLSELEFRVEPCNEPFAAVKKLMAEHFDAIVVDCDSEQNAALLFKSAHNSGSNQSSLAVAVVEGQAGVAKAFRIGANLVLTKPINVEQSKGTLRVARGLLRKTEAAKPAGTMAATTQPAPVTGISSRRPSTSQIPEPKPAPSSLSSSSLSLPAQPPRSPIPAVSASVFEVETDLGPPPEAAEAALLESMPAPLSPSIPTKEYPWQPTSKPAAEPMANALRRAAEATGRSEEKSEVDSPASTRIGFPSATVPDAPIRPSYASSMASGQAAATAPAKISPQAQEETERAQQLEPPAFASLGAPSGEPASGGGKKAILIAAAVLVAAAVGYAGWSKMQPGDGTPSPQKLTAPVHPAPVHMQSPAAATTPSSPSPVQDNKTTTTPSQAATAKPSEQGPDITLSTSDTRPPVPTKSASIIATNTVVRNPPEATAPTPMVVKSEVSDPALRSPAHEDSAPPAAQTLGVAANANDQAIAGLMSTTATTLPQQAPQKLKISQGVSQGLLIKSVPPVYPALARQMHIQGAVELLANIGKDGSITAVKLLNGDSVLSHAAIDAVKQWKYKPYYLNDQAVEIQTQITVKFKLP